MRLKFVFPLVALAVVLTGVSTSRASHCGATSAPTACASQCCPKVRYKTVYHTVVEEQKKTCYKNVEKIVEKECKVKVCKPVYETKEVECKKTICEQVWEEKKVKVCTGEWKTEQYCCPGHKTWKLVREPGCCTVDPCTGCARHSHGSLKLVCCEGPATMKCRKVWVPKEEEKTIKVCKMVPKEVTEKVKVTTCKLVETEETRKIQCKVCERVPTEVTVKVCKKVACQVAVCDSHCGLLDSLKGLFHHDGCCASACPAAEKAGEKKGDK